MAGYDGSIIINTLIATEAFAAGMNKLSTKFSQVAASLGNVLKKALIGAMLFFAVSAAQIFKTVRDNLGMLLERAGLQPQVQDLQDRFEELKVAVANAFLPLVVAALPYIKLAIVWLTELANKVAMIMAALMGQKEVLQVIVGSANAYAKNTEKAAKATRGALAAFDQINVLNQQDTAVAGPDLTPAQTVATEMVPVTDEILKKVADIKQQFLDTWQAIRDGAVAAWDWVVSTWSGLSAWFSEYVIAPIVGFFSGLWAAVENYGVVGGIIYIFEQIGQKVYETFNNIVEIAKWAWNWLKEIWGTFGDWFRAKVTDPLVAWMSAAWDNIKSSAATAWDNIRSVVATAKDRILGLWGAIGDWFTRNVSDPIRNSFSTALDWIRDNFASVFEGIKSVARGVINSIIGLLNSMFNISTAALNGLIDGANAFGSTVPGWVAIPTVQAPQIPYLATGAVIPPNSQFLAVLGDQRSGNNIEAPEGLIRQIIREEMGTVQGNFAFGVEGTLAALVREMRPYVVREDVRIGPSLVGGSK